MSRSVAYYSWALGLSSSNLVDPYAIDGEGARAKAGDGYQRLFSNTATNHIESGKRHSAPFFESFLACVGCVVYKQLTYLHLLKSIRKNGFMIESVLMDIPIVSLNK